MKNLNYLIIKESFSKFEIEKIKEINSEINIDDFNSFYSILEDLKIFNIPEDFTLSAEQLLKEKVSELLNKIRTSFINIKSIDLVVYLEILITMNNTVNLRQPLITPINYNLTQNIMTQNEKKVNLMSFVQYITEKKLEISMSKENLLKFSELIIDSLFKVENEISEDMIKSIIFKNKKYEDSILYYRILDSIKDVENNPAEFLYCLALSNCHTISNLKNLGELNAREIRFMCNSIKAEPEKYRILNR